MRKANVQLAVAATAVLVRSGRPTVLLEDVAGGLGLGLERDRLSTPANAEFAQLRTHAHGLAQAAEHGARTLDDVALAS